MKMKNERLKVLGGIVLKDLENGRHSQNKK